MSTDSNIAKVFWPKNLSGSGYIVGWHVRNVLICVATVIPEMELNELDSVVEQIASSSSGNLNFMHHICSSVPAVLGVCMKGEDLFLESIEEQNGNVF